MGSEVSAQPPTAHGPQASLYRGRFAPSPSGPLHFGSLVTAVGSYLQARQAQGRWLVRIEDLDPPRTVPGAADDILRTLDIFGLTWDEAVLFQSSRTAAYQQALHSLIDRGLAYRCSCSRSELQALPQPESAAGEELYYPGRCAQGPLRPQGPHAWRFRVPIEPLCFQDGLQGLQRLDLRSSCGDFVIQRRDGWFAYQLAVVVDDAAQGISEVVRGADLLLNTPRQIALQQALDLPTPRHVHLPLATDAQGQKLAKSSGAAPLDARQAPLILWQALCWLRQSPPEALRGAGVAELWQWAVSHWNIDKLRNLLSMPIA